MRWPEYRSGNTQIIVEWDLPYPSEKVWRALTEAELIGQWPMPNNFQPRRSGQPGVGTRFTFKTKPRSPSMAGVPAAPYEFPAAASFAARSRPFQCLPLVPCPYPYESRPGWLVNYSVPDTMLESTGPGGHRTKDCSPVTGITIRFKRILWG